ncbi:MAG: response regulator [Candidatus Marinimicrobia bacterium]|nr:response regulator [Candidatus Neomarinimicrobiota bacterium]|tara:strand:- start:782 stop:2341 length:1560 start_codon:yes stop_codon:yes gene_type:complete
MKQRGKILWVDDEVDLLKPHILYLEEKGYSVEKVTNGRDGLSKIVSEQFDLVLLDQVMPGMDGIAVLRDMKEFDPRLPVIMITKNEEEWLMDEAISEKTAGYLTKPVNPSQIFLACKKILEEDEILEKRAAGAYLEELQEIERLLAEAHDIDDWWNLYYRLVQWQIELESQKEMGLQEKLADQLRFGNRGFVRFVYENYRKWVRAERGERPCLSIDMVKAHLTPLLKQGEKVLFVVVDCLRLDQALAILPVIQRRFQAEIDYHVSVLPTATPFARNAIFSGRYLADIQGDHPELWKKTVATESSMNQAEPEMFGKLLNRLTGRDVNHSYHKVNVAREGQRFLSRMKEYGNHSVIALVVNFVDLLTHHRAESDVLQEIIPDESGYRKLVETWFANSWLSDVFDTAADMDLTVLLTTDHGSIRVKKGIKVAADRETSTGIRYKYGRSLQCSERNALVIKRASDYRLPEMVKGTNYLIAKEDAYFVYPTQYHKYLGQLQDSFQHGGISLEEMLVPTITLRRR